MTGLTQSDRLTRVHNGRICHPVATLLAEQVKLTHRLSSVSKAESMKPLLSKLNSVHMRFPLLGFSLGLVSNWAFYQ